MALSLLKMRIYIELTLFPSIIRLYWSGSLFNFCLDLAIFEELQLNLI
jgi:hypothetical protein